jgi:hypothetical protein
MNNLELTFNLYITNKIKKLEDLVVGMVTERGEDEFCPLKPIKFGYSIPIPILSWKEK